MRAMAEWSVRDDIAYAVSAVAIVLVYLFVAGFCVTGCVSGEVTKSADAFARDFAVYRAATVAAVASDAAAVEALGAAIMGHAERLRGLK